MAFLEDSIGCLKESGYKITGPRTAVLQALAKADVPLSAHDLEGRIPKGIPINVVTIYRVLEVFQKLGIAHRIHTREGFVRCDFKLKAGCHYFAVCTRCGRTTEFLHKDSCLLEKIIPKSMPFKELGHIAEVSGICEHCSGSKSQSFN